MTTTAAKWYFRTNDGFLVIATEFETIEEARASAQRWNADPNTQADRRVAIIANAPRTAEATRVTTVTTDTWSFGEVR